MPPLNGKLLGGPLELSTQLLSVLVIGAVFLAALAVVARWERRRYLASLTRGRRRV